MKLFRGAILAVLLAGLVEPAGAALPEAITLTVAAKLELTRGDKVTGSIGLAPGEKLALIDVAGDYALVRYRNLNGRVLAASTDLPRAEGAGLPAEVAGPPQPAAALLPSAPVPTERTARAYVPANALERALAGKLVHLENGALRPFDAARLAGVKFYAIYYSASWCAPCREFTPGLVDAYAKIRALYPEFEVVLVNADRSAADMAAYVRDDGMAWPAVRWDAIRDAREITRYAGSGIPCLVLVDENGRVLSDTNRWGRYVGPDAVLDDTWKILRDYRRKNPRVKT